VDARTVQIRRRGVITIPAELRRQYDLDEGEALMLVDLGDGALLFTPPVSRMGRMGDKVAKNTPGDTLAWVRGQLAGKAEGQRRFQ